MSTTATDERERRGLPAGAQLRRTVNGIQLERLHWGAFRNPDDGTLYVWDVIAENWILAHPCRRGMLGDLVGPGA